MRTHYWIRTHAAVLLIAVAGGSALPASAKKSRPPDPPADPSTPAAPASNADVAKAESAATVSLASIKMARLALAEDAELAPVKPALSPIYDREESGTRDGLNKLKAAGSDAKAKAAAMAEIKNAGAESANYFARSPDVKQKVDRRVTIMNGEVGQIAKSPSKYVRQLGRCGLAGDKLNQASSIVTEASAKAGGKAEGDSLDAVLNARSQVRQMLSAEQARALDAAFGGK